MARIGTGSYKTSIESLLILALGPQMVPPDTMLAEVIEMKR
jgi:hypothetical protein